jgi:8-oxo-dGTP pyrophosphatase MutT (NUDIX family)
VGIFVPAASAIIACGRLILFVRSKRTGSLWAFPGGRTEPGESPSETAIREAREEVGLEIDVISELGTYRISNSSGGGFEIRCFSAASDKTDLLVDTSEILEARWCRIEEGMALDLVPTARAALKRFADEVPNYPERH